MAGIVGLTELQHTNGTSAATINTSGVVDFSNPPTGVIKSGTIIESTSGTAVDFTGIPTTNVQNITVLLSSVSTSGNSNLLLQLGHSGGFETSGYLGTIGNTGGGILVTSGVGITYSINNTYSTHSQLTCWLVDPSTNTWSISSLGSGSVGGVCYFGTFSKSLSAPLDRVRVTATNGTDTFDAGKIVLRYAG